MAEQAPPKGGRRRRRRRRRRPESGAPRNADARADARESAEAAAAVIEGPVLDLDAPADKPLSDAEMVEAERHLAFIRRTRKVLRLRLNDAENLVIDGARKAEHRGQLKHLLAKIDKSAAVAALARKPICDDPKARASLLEGVARISGDLDVLFMWLEALAASAGRMQASGAFGAAVERIHFGELSPSRMDRLLRALEAGFEGHERVQALFGLLENDSFRRAFDASESALEAGAAGRLKPLAAVHRAFVAKAGRGDAVDTGLERMLAAPPEVLAGYRPAVRMGLLDAAVRRGGPAAAVEGLLKSLPVDEQACQDAAWRWAGDRVRAGEEAAAVRVLRKVRGDRSRTLIQALGEDRLGNYALMDGKGLDVVGLRPGYDLSRQASVLIRVGAPASSGVMATEGHLQAALCLPAVAPALESGMGERGTPFVALPPGGELMWESARGVPVEEARRMAWDGVRILRALAAVGARLPDAEPSRFRQGATGGLELVDLSGIREERVLDALTAHRGLARAWVLRCMSWPTFGSKASVRREASPALRALLEHPEAPDYPAWAVLAG